MREKAQRGGHLPKATELMNGEAGPWGLELIPHLGQEWPHFVLGIPTELAPCHQRVSVAHLFQPAQGARGCLGRWNGLESPNTSRKNSALPQRAEIIS